MEITIEYVLIDNVVINYIILFLSCKLLKQKVVFWKLFLAAVIGAGFALILPIIYLPSYLLILLKLSLGFLMVLMSLPCNTFKRCAASFLTFLLMTGVMGGVCFAIIYMLSGNLSTDILLNYSAPIPVGVILFICCLTAYLLNSLIKLFYKKRKENNFIYSAIIWSNGKKVKVNAFLDSGNTLVDPVYKKPVIIISYSLFHKLYNLPLEKVLMKNITSKDIKNSHYISFNTVGKSAEMLVFEIESIEIILSKEKKRKLENVLLGLSFGSISKTFSCEVLLHPDYVYC